MDREALAGLLDRVKAATGPDRELDLAIATALVPDVLVMRQRDDDTGADPYTYWKYTASVDAALALVERLFLHAATVEPSINIGAARHSCILRLVEREEPFVAENLRTPALAILAATLTALLDQESK